MAQDIHVPKASHLGWLINQAFHGFELTVPVIGPIPAQLTSDKCNYTITFTKPHEIIAITSILPVSRESICRSELTDDTHLSVYAVSNKPATESPTLVTIKAPEMTKLMPSPKQVHYMESPGHVMPSHPTLRWQQ